jgi:hypothetical protein
VPRIAARIYARAESRFFSQLGINDNLRWETLGEGFFRFSKKKNNNDNWGWGTAGALKKNMGPVGAAQKILFHLL